MLKTSIRLTVAAAMMITINHAQSRQISLSEALNNAPENLTRGMSRSAEVQAYTQTEGDLNVAYIVANGSDNGYVVLAADDVMPPVLGYADTGTFDANNIPPAMAAWLKSYGSQLEYAASHNYVSASRSETTDFEPISPLCTCIWGQDSPYNLSCPEIGGENAPTGCTATSMAQMAYYHKWPVTGTGTNTYTSTTINEVLTFDFGNTTFAWSNMVDSYLTATLPQKQRAVATLMLACGNACLTNYGEDGSGAYPYDAIYGLVNFMNYDKSSASVDRDYFTSDEWQQLVYNEIANNRPVLYGGTSNDGGHAFVVDGYSSNGFFHVNWGWDGMSDGYFLLTALDPMEQGTGGSSSGYNFYQNASINLMPAKEGTEYTFIMYQEGNLTTDKYSYSSSDNIKISAGSDRNSYFDYFTLVEQTVELGLNLTPEAGGDPVFYKGTDVAYSPYYGKRTHDVTRNYTLSAASLPKSGTYIATPAFRVNGFVGNVHPKVGYVKEFRMVCSESGVEITPVEINRTITISDFKATSVLYGGKSCTFGATISNSGDEFYGFMSVGIARTSTGTPICWLDGTNVSLPDGHSVEISFSGTLTNYNTGADLAAGTYYANLYDNNDNPLTDKPVAIEISAVPTEEVEFNTIMAAVGKYEGAGTSADPYIVGDDFKFSLTLDVTAGLFDESVYFFSYYLDDYSATDLYIYADYIADAHFPQTKEFTIDTSGYDEDRTVYIRPYRYLSTGWSYMLKRAQCLFIKRVAGGINDVAVDTKGGIYPNPAVSNVTVTAASDISSIDIYSLSGSHVMSIAPASSASSASVDVSALPTGHYIMTVTTSAGIDRHRLMKK